MEIKTCEQYVLAELEKLRNENEALRQQNEEEKEGWAEIVSNLNKKLANYQQVIEAVKKHVRLIHHDKIDHDRMMVDFSAWDDDPMFVPFHDLYIEAGEEENEQ